ncbi:hypothetical protein LSAT2_028332 [Lamellibrachia satsuma]|nr:hypothetical protein LSAT2_028332 [Lamellibrachia satsuma]
MSNTSESTIGDAATTNDDYATIIPDVALLFTVNDMFNNTIERMLNNTNVTSLQPRNAAVNYVELDIHHAIRLYYQVFVALSGIVANVLALVVTLSKRMRKHSTCFYMSAISGSDALTLVIAFLWWLGRYVNTTSVWSCKLILFSFYYAIHLSVTLLVAMSAERFVAIRFPFWAHVHLTRRKSVQVIVGVAMAILALDVHNLFTRTMLVNATTGRKMCLFSNSATLDMSYGFFHIYIWPWIDASVYSFFPLTMLVVFNVLIIHSVRQRAAEMKQLSDADTKPGTGTTSSGTEQQITTMLLSVTFAFIILTGPIAVTLILEKFWDPPTEAHGSAIWRLWRTIVSNLMYTNHAINFLLYSLSGQKFRRELRRLLTCACSEPPEGGSGSSMSTRKSVASVSNVEANVASIDTHM